MMPPAEVQELTFTERIAMLRAAKMRHTEEKWRVLGSIDMDDLPVILPPAESRKVVRIISGSGLSMPDAVFSNFSPPKQSSQRRHIRSACVRGEACAP
jgi:hypothetical protein